MKFHAHEVGLSLDQSVNKIGTDTLPDVAFVVNEATGADVT